MTIRIVIADDQPLVRSGFRMIIDERADLELVGEAADGEQAVALARELDPDVILMDIRMPKLDGVEATRRLVETGTRARILVLTTFDIDEYVYAAVHAGASGFLLKDIEPAQLVDAIRVVAAGNSACSPKASPTPKSPTGSTSARQPSRHMYPPSCASSAFATEYKR